MRLIALSCLSLWLAACHFDVHLDDKPNRSSSQDAGGGDEQDAGMPDAMGEPDAGDTEQSDAGQITPPMPAVFKDDFERASGPLVAPWKDAGTGAPKIWAGQLCVGPQETALLTLEPGDYRYLRVDVTGGLGLRWTLESEEGEFLSFLWYPDGSQITASSGEELARFTRMQVRSVEVYLDPGTRSARVRVDGGAWTKVTYASKVRAKLVRMRFQSTYADPQFHSGATECFDNVYAGPAQPTEDPFKDSPPVRPGWYTKDQTELCLLDHCGNEMIGCMDDTSSCDTCSCENSYFNVLMDCLTHDPSGTMAQCSWLAFSVANRETNLQDPATKALIACADAHCATDIAKTPLANGGGAWSQYDAIPATDVVLAATRHGNDIDVVEVDLGTGAVKKLGGTLTQAFQSASDSSVVHPYTTTNHEWRNLQLIAHDGSQRLFAAEEGVWAEIVVRQPFVSFQPFPTREWIWVDSAPASGAPQYTHQLLSTRGRAFIRRTDPHGSNDYVTLHDPVDDGSHAYAVSNSASGPTVFAMGDGFIRDLTPGVGSAWRAIATFDASVVFRNPITGSLRWLGLDNQPITQQLPSTQLVGSYWIGASSIWVTGAEAPVAVASKPGDLMDELPVASNDLRVLYENAQHWVFADTAGNRLGEYVPAPFADMTEGESMATAARFTIGPNCGLLVSKRAAVSEERAALDVFHFDSEGKLVVERLDALAQAAADVRVAVRREGLIVWQRGADLRAYDCSAFRSYLTHPVGDPIVALGDYPPVPQHFIPAPPPVTEPDP
jgi:hypothetical protein